jgi:hypothetical protein
MAKAAGANAKRMTRDLDVKNMVSVDEDVEGYSTVRVMNVLEMSGIIDKVLQESTLDQTCVVLALLEENGRPRPPGD